MVFITIAEIIDIIIMVVAIGFIFSRFFKREIKHTEDVLEYYQKRTANPILDQIIYGSMIAAPAVVLHELAHKFVAMGFGATATLHAPITMYIIVIFLLLVNFPIIFFVGGYVSHSALPALPSAAVAIAGPLTNLVLWLIFFVLAKQGVWKKYNQEIMMMAKLNMFLFIFNMIPFPGFDGYHFFRALLMAFGA